MKLWNCVDLRSELGSDVLERFPKGRAHHRPKPLLSSAAAKMTVGAAVIAMTATFTISAGSASRAEVFLPIPGAHFAQSLQQLVPSIESEFQNRFDNSWTREQEAELLARLESRRKIQSPGASSEAVLDAIFSNQNEDPTDDTGKLQREEIRKMLSKRRRG
jgi:hypothetical protein